MKTRKRASVPRTCSCVMTGRSPMTGRRKPSIDHREGCSLSAAAAAAAAFAACGRACRFVAVDEAGRAAGLAVEPPPSLLKESPNEDLDFAACTFAIRLS